MIAKRLVTVMMIVLVSVSSLQAQERVSDADAWREFVQRLEPHALVRVRTRDGKSMKGYVVHVEPDAMRINPRTRVAVPLREVPFAEVLTVDRLKEPKWNPAAKVLLGVGVGVGTLMLLTVLALAGGYD
jgi:hypothetical protein